MSQTPVLTGQDIAEAYGALERQLERVLGPTGNTRHEYVLLRVLAARSFESVASLHEYLASQRQLGLTLAAAIELLARLQARGLTAGTAKNDSWPIELTLAGAELLRTLTETVAPNARQIFAGLERHELETAHHVLRQIVDSAERVGD